ncbi:hypothetical protein [Aquimarina pacifica]|uniref:hypothetical protein n=1 Tax=Aquimarina pacifica TaxID=1296415 RepID=UPI000470AC77|nr:hypothetical protein [Aquimarina pacifica]
MENKKAIKLIDKILGDLEKTGINSDTLIDDIKELRTYALEEQIPLVVKVLRYTYEHIEKNDSFLIPIPDDEPVEEEEASLDSQDSGASDPVESLKYMIALTKKLNNRMNISDLKEYRDALMEY